MHRGFVALVALAACALGAPVNEEARQLQSCRGLQCWLPSRSSIVSVARSGVWQFIEDTICYINHDYYGATERRLQESATLCAAAPAPSARAAPLSRPVPSLHAPSCVLVQVPVPL